MSIEDDLLDVETITEGDRALALFTDRYEFTRLFVERLNDDPAPQSIVFLYGEGGNGKSLLLKHLRKNVCKRLISKDDWQTIKVKPDAELADNITRLKPQVCYAVPTAFLDFGAKPLRDAQPQDRFYGLLTLRRDLGESAKGNYSLPFQRFDFACVWYLHKKGKSPDEIKAFFPLDQAGNLASVLVDVLTKNPFGTAGKALLDVFNPEWSQRLMVRMARLGLSQDVIETILRLDVDTELIEALPGYLAADLNDAMARDNAPPRLVLFFDTHEAFWGENRSEARANYFFRDEWLRLLLRKLNYAAGIVAVVAGRDKPRWAEAKAVKPKTDIPVQYLDLQRVGNLSAADALAYLQQPDVDIEDVALCQSLIAYASVEPGEVHPLHLGLCADVVLQAQAQGTPLTAAEFGTVPDFADKSKLLVERLLKYVSDGVRDAVYALSACRAFDKDLYRRLGQTLNFASYDADFELITRFSFVKQLPEQRQDWHRLHGLLRRLNAEDGNEQVLDAHRFLEQYYRANGDQAETIYHLNQLSPRAGTEAWVCTFDQALELSCYQTCEALLEVRRDLRLASYFQLGSMSQSEGDYYQSLARYEEAAQEYLESVWAYEKSFRENGTIAALNNGGNSLSKLGDLQLKLSQHAKALGSHQIAIAAFEEALRRAPDYIDARNNKGSALIKLGDVQAELSQHTEALGSYQTAIAVFEEALHRTPDHIYALNNKGNALKRLGELQAGLSDHAEALDSYQSAISTFDEALRVAPDYIYALNNKGTVLKSLGDLQARLSNHTEALSSYQTAIAAHDEVLRRAPDDINAHNDKGNTLNSLGDLQAELSQHTEALGNYQSAISTFDEALRRAPNYIGVLSNKGNALKRLGELQAGLSDHAEALDSYQSAISTFDEALRRAPDFIGALNNKGTLLQSQGKLQAGLSQHTEAVSSYQSAISTFDEALRRAPDHIYALNNKGIVLKSLGELQSDLSQHTEAVSSYQSAISTFDEALRRAPDFIGTLNNKGTVLQSQGNLQAGLSNYAEAVSSYQSAISAFDEALRCAPDYINALYNKGNALIKLAELQGSLGHETEAIQNLHLALACFSRSLDLAPNDSFSRKKYDQIQAFLASSGFDSLEQFTDDFMECREQPPLDKRESLFE